MTQQEINKAFSIAEGCNISLEGNLITFQDPSATKICKVADALEAAGFRIIDIQETKNKTWFGKVTKLDSCSHI